MQYQIKSYPKINLALDILKKNESGFHEIQTVFHEIKEPADEIILEYAKTGEIIVDCDNPALKTDNTNTVLKAAKLLKNYAATEAGAKIFIKKKIPLMSGLGGGSSNAVCALKGLAKLWKINCCEDQKFHNAPNCLLKRIANQIGMDCVFFFHSGTALGAHFGEKITSLPVLPTAIRFEIIETGIEIASHWAYGQIDIEKCGLNRNKTEKLLAALEAQDKKGILENIHNDFENFIFEKFPRLFAHKKEIESKKSGKVILCGSGGALVRVYS